MLELDAAHELYTDHYSKAFDKGLILMSCNRCFFRLEDLITTRVKAMGRRDNSDSFIKLFLKLGCHGFTRRFNKDRFHNDRLII